MQLQESEATKEAGTTYRLREVHGYRIPERVGALERAEDRVRAASEEALERVSALALVSWSALVIAIAAAALAILV